MNWRKDVSREHDYHDQVQQIVSKTMQAHGLEDEKLQAVLTDLLEEMNRITLTEVGENSPSSKRLGA
ncbi:hypothetical protein M3591_00895 [Exiguobacterium sp. MER 193]|uniref:hypothetical protein n=1 Tax=unclassified Exiguobacterium TaxID=2644629 RepID=UPI001BEA8222|nr:MULTISPECIES: hypothetical protein [unclassified Exiguobacterium]MCM3279084.1 hypothetical protein [Exiguobacterium sp. MER 193]